MADKTSLIRQIRFLIAEKMIGWSLDIMPDSDTKTIWAIHVRQFMRGHIRRTLEQRE
jgi:hypothetical protein